MIWNIGSWQKVLMTIGALAVVVAGWLVFKPHNEEQPQPALPVVEAVVVDTTQTAGTSTIESKHEEKRRVKVRVIVPPETVIGGDSAMVIEIVIEDSSNTESSVEEVKVEDRGLRESVTVAKQEVLTDVERERLIGVFAGAGYLPEGELVVPEVGVSLHVYKLLYAQGGVGLDGLVFGFGGGALKIGEVFGLRILTGIGYTTDRQVMVSLSIGG